MRDKCRSFQLWLKLAFFFAMASAWVTPSWGQFDLQIIVNGPWTYYTPDSKTLYLIASGNSAHGFYIYEGEDVARWKKLAPQPAGIYTVSFDGVYHTGQRPSKGRGAVPLELSNVCSAASVGTDLGKLVQKRANYIVQLPYPDKFSTYEDLNEQWDGYSESRAEPVGSTSTVSGTTPATLYTTTMVLHYWVKSGIPQTLDFWINGVKQSAIKTSFPSTNPPEGITIVSAVDQPQASWKCDDMSLASVSERNTLLTISQHVLFPAVVDLNGHQSHHYHYNCPQFKPSAEPQTAAVDHDADKELNSLTELIAACREITTACAHITSAGGSADCHTCQLSVGDSIPPPTP